MLLSAFILHFLFALQVAGTFLVRTTLMNLPTTLDCCLRVLSMVFAALTSQTFTGVARAHDFLTIFFPAAEMQCPILTAAESLQSLLLKHLVTILTAHFSFLMQVVGTPFQRGLHLLMNLYMSLTNFCSVLFILERTPLAILEMGLVAAFLGALVLIVAFLMGVNLIVAVLFLVAAFLWSLLRAFLALDYPFL